MAGRNLLAPAAAPTKGRNLLSEGQAQAAREQQASAGAENEPGILQQLFDVKNADTGESYLYGNRPAAAPYEDLQRTVADTVSRGYLDKLRGPEEQAKTLAARERMPGWVELPTDIGAAVASSPYRVAGMGMGALIGGAEGAASAYGHQKDWIPDAEGAWDIAKGTAIGSVAGAGGAKLGEWIGGSQASKAAEEARPYKVDADLDAAAATRQREAIDAEKTGFDDLSGVLGTEADELAERSANVAKIRATQGKSRDEFAKMRAGLDNPSPEVEALGAKIAGDRGKLQKAADRIPNAVTRGGLTTTLLSDLALGHVPTAVRTTAKVLKAAGKSEWANKVPDEDVAKLAKLARDGILKLDPAIIDKWRDRFAKTAIGTARRP